MSDVTRYASNEPTVTRYVNNEPSVSRQVFTGSPILVGGTGEASQVAISPPIPGLTATDVRGAFVEQQQKLPFKYTFSFGDASPVPILTADANTVIKTVRIVMLVPFNGTNSSIAIGDAGNAGRLMPIAGNSPLEAAEWEYNPNYRYASATPILLTITPSGSTAGSGIIYIERG